MHHSRWIEWTSESDECIERGREKGGSRNRDQCELTSHHLVNSRFARANHHQCQCVQHAQISSAHANPVHCRYQVNCIVVFLAYLHFSPIFASSSSCRSVKKDIRVGYSMAHLVKLILIHRSHVNRHRPLRDHRYRSYWFVSQVRSPSVHIHRGRYCNDHIFIKIIETVFNRQAI